MEDEIWKPINGCDKFYEVSNLGRVRSLDRIDACGRLRRGRILKTHTSKYKTVGLSVGGVTKTTAVHRIVGETFLPKAEGKNTINHKNLDKEDNRVCNLEWMSQKEQISHALDCGVYTIGEDRTISKLCNRDVQLIRYMVNVLTFRQAHVCELYGVVKSTVNSIIKGRTWKHLPIDYSEFKLHFKGF